MSTHFSFTSRLAGSLFLLLAALGGNVHAMPAEDPQAIAQNVYAEIKANLNVDLSDTVVNQYFDTRSMAVQALGMPYRGLSESQRTAYQQAFDAYFKKSIYRVLTTYKTVTISNLNSRVEANRAIVRCVITPANGEPVKLALNLALDQDAWKANDVVVDGISLIVSYKPQFDSLYKQNGFDGLIAYLTRH